MSLQETLGMDIARALSLSEDFARSGALRRLAGLIDGANLSETNEREAFAHPSPDIATREDMLAKQEVDSLTSLRAVHELDIMGYVDKGKRTCAIIALARLARLPLTTAQRLFVLKRADFLLVICRAQCFAWSTTERLLFQMQGVTLDAQRISDLCDEYHDMPIAMAQRFGRFLCAHFPPDRSRLT